MPSGVRASKGGSDGGRETRWPGWLGLSGLLHALLLAGLVVLAALPDPPREESAPHVKVRLENEPPTVPTPVLPAEQAFKKQPRPAARRPVPQVEPPRMAPAPAPPPREEPTAVAPPERPMASVTPAPPPPLEKTGDSTVPDTERPSVAPAPPGRVPNRVEDERPYPRGQGGPDGAPPLGPVGEGPSRASVLQPGRPDLPPGIAEGWDPARTSETGSLPVRQGAVAGLFVITDAGGSGTGERGRGAGDRGTGTGGAGMGTGGHGAAGSGPGGLGGSGSGAGGGGDRLASRSPGGGTGQGDGVTGLLRAIRRRIEQAQSYPDEARRAGMQGTVEVRFRILPDGSADAVEIVRSSGHPALDEASLQTVRRAGPYPAVSGRIRIPLSYRLDR